MVFDLLEIADPLDKRVLSTLLRRNVTIREQLGATALQVVSRFAANPKWLICLPPTCCPAKPRMVGGVLEHSRDAFVYYSHQSQSRVVCDESLHL